jgi:tRNA threonylcarbamoyladenosine biosynthesis protein TsaB
VVATDARRKEVYWARYASARSRVTEPAVGAPVQAAAPGLPVIGEGAALYPEVLDPGGEGEVAPLRPSAAALAELAVHGLSGGDGPPLLELEPLYLRRPDAQVPGARKKVTA